MCDKEAINFIRLTRGENIGPITVRRLLATYGSATAAVKAALAGAPGFQKTCGRRDVGVASEKEARQEYERGLSFGARLIRLNDGIYPEALSYVRDAPPFFWAIGNCDRLKQPGCGIVGSRNASVSARKFSAVLGEKIGKAGYAVISGLARGVDGAAHEAALRTEGGTIAVVAGGVNVIYPPEHKKLYTDILDAGGVILSENAPDAEPIAKFFPRRNRIISGLSLGVVIVEATLRSGSLTTARFATEQGREVFAVPGFPLDARSAGTNGLLKNGAILTETAEDVLTVLDTLRNRRTMFELAEPAPVPESPPLPFPVEAVQKSEDPEEKSDETAILSLLGANDVAIDEIIRFSGLTTETVLTILPQLEFAGKIIRVPGGAYRPAP